MTRGCKIDESQPAIVDALRDAGATIQHIHTIGRGCPDILVGYRGKNILFEIKTTDHNSKMTDSETSWHRRWKGQVAVVRSPEEAVDTLNVLASTP